MAGETINRSLLGHSTDRTSDVAVVKPAEADTIIVAGDPATSALDTDPSPVGPAAHSVVHMLQVNAATTIPEHQDHAGIVAPAQAPIAQPDAPIVGADPVHNEADMAALTRTAKANLGALVTGLNAACLAGGKCLTN